MSAWALREEKVYLQMTRASGRLEQTANATEPDWDTLFERQQPRNRWNNWSRSLRAHQQGVVYESVDGYEGNAWDADSWYTDGTALLRVLSANAG